jgi:CheY-like chemotaxis protein
VLTTLLIAKEQGVTHNGASRVILVVEDEWLVREVMVQVLRNAGWRVIEASSAEDAIALMRTGHPYIDVVFTDIQLAGRLCGWDVAEQCRATRADFPVIYASGNAADRSGRVPGSLFFEKPYGTAEVVEACNGLACAAQEAAGVTDGGARHPRLGPSACQE